MRKHKIVALVSVAALVIVAGGAQSATSFDVRLVSQTANTLTLGWAPQPGYGYLFSSAGVLRSRTNDPSRSTVKFAKVTPASYDVDVIAKGNTGIYTPGVAPPPPPTGSIRQTIVNASTIPDVTSWRAVYDANGDGIEDDPGSIRFLVDGVQVLSEDNAPFGDTFATGTPSVTAGLHTFRVDAVNASGAVVATNTVSATVGAPPPPPPPPPSGCALPAFPDASCTGVPAGTALTPSGGLTITQAGAVVNALDITGAVVVNAPNVTIKNTRIRTNAMFAVTSNSTGLVIQDSEIVNRPVAGQPNCHVGVGSSNFTILRSEITGCENALDISSPGNVTFNDNYVHDLDTTGPSYVWGNSPHTDGIQVGNGATNLVFLHNTIDPVGDVVGGGVTSAIIMYVSQTSTPNVNVRIEDNYLDGRDAAFTLYVPRVQTHDFFVNRNRMLKGVYGLYTACVKVGITVTTFDDNRDATTGALITPDNGVGGGCVN